MGGGVILEIVNMIAISMIIFFLNTLFQKNIRQK